MSMIRKGKDEYVLCNGTTCACPEVIIDDQEVTIVDDYDDTIRMTLDQFVVIAQVVDTLKAEGKLK